jgi:hypothetical protein
MGKQHLYDERRQTGKQTNRQTDKIRRLFAWPPFFNVEISTVFSSLICVVLGYSLLQQNKLLDVLSYVAVL